MRYLIPPMALLLSACSTLGLEWEDGSLMTRTSAVERRTQKVQAEQAAWRVAHPDEVVEYNPDFVIQTGLSATQIKKQYGKPEMSEMHDGSLYYRMTAQGQPMVFKFTQDKLVEWSIDQKESNRRLAQAQHDQEADQRSQEIEQSKRVSCTTHGFGRMVTTNCH